MGRGTKPPPQFGQTLPRMLSTHVAQNVHSYVQMRASSESGGNALLQFSQVGLSSSMVEVVARSYRGGIKITSIAKERNHPVASGTPHSSNVIPDPPISFGMSFIFGKPSFIRNFVS